MLLVIYNSNSQNISTLETIKGWSLYTQEDWAALCKAVDNYFFYMAQEEPELLAFGLIGYYSYKEWLSDYQVSEIDINWFMTKFQSQAGTVPCLDWLLGTDFYVPPFLQLEVEVDYPEMDAYA
jgi:hypothetical protein